MQNDPPQGHISSNYLYIYSQILYCVGKNTSCLNISFITIITYLTFFIIQVTTQ